MHYNFGLSHGYAYMDIFKKSVWKIWRNDME